MKERFNAQQTFTKLVGFKKSGDIIVSFGAYRIFQVTEIETDGTGSVSFCLERDNAPIMTAGTIRPLLDAIEHRV